MLRLWPILSAFAFLAVLVAACNGDGEGTTPPADETPEAGETPAPSPALAPTPMTFAERPELTISADEKIFAIVETEKGSFRIELRPDGTIGTEICWLNPCAPTEPRM